MPLSPDLLAPIPGENPSGQDLYRTPLFAAIREARRQEEAGPQGVWEREPKVADFELAAKLCSNALKNQTKDLFLATWLAEALIYREGFPGLKDGIDLIRGLIETFWDTLYPESEPGEDNPRLSPLEWFGNYFDPGKNSSPALAVRMRPITANGITWLQYQDSRRNPAEEGKPALEDVDTAIDQSPKALYTNLHKDIAACTASLQALDDLCAVKFGEFIPSFANLRRALDDTGGTVWTILRKKRDIEPDPVEETTTAPPAAADIEETTAAHPTTLGDIRNHDDAIQHILAAVRYLRRNEPQNPAGYLVSRALRWGELRQNGPVPDPAILAAAPVEVRTQVKKYALEGKWADALNAAEQAAGMPCGRGWLDLHRYAIRACEELGAEYAPVARAIRSALRSLLVDYPGLPEMFLMDDTPTANLETQKWLRTHVLNSERLLSPLAAGSDGNVYEHAMEAVHAGNTTEAIESISRQLACADCGRSRFIRRVELAQVLIAIEKEAIAYPILKELTEEIEHRKLDEWEARELVARPLALLYRCMAKLQGDPTEMQELLTRICKLDVAQALSCQA